MAGGRGAREGARKRTRKTRTGETPPRDLTELEAKWLGSQLAMRSGSATVTNGVENPADIQEAAPEAPGGTGNTVEAEWEPRQAQAVTVGAEPAPMEPPAIEPAAAGPLSQESRDASTGGAGHAGTAGDANRPVAEERQDSPRHQARFDSFWRFG